MTAKRFIIDEYFGIGSVVIDTENKNVRFKHENELSMKQCCDLLNELNDKCKFLEIENESLEDGATKYAEMSHKSLKEIVDLKDEIKQLKKKLNTFNEVNELYKKENELHRKENKMLSEQIGDDYNEANSMTVKISELTDENKEIKELIHTMLKQIDVEKIGSDCNTVYSARIIFTGREFKKIKEIWNMRGN